MLGFVYLAAIIDWLSFEIRNCCSISTPDDSTWFLLLDEGMNDCAVKILNHLRFVSVSCHFGGHSQLRNGVVDLTFVMRL